MDLPQAFLLIVIVVISVILTIIGVQIILLLRDAKTTLSRIDKVMDHLEFLTRNLTNSSASLEHIAEGFKSGMQLVGTITNFISTRSKTKKN